MVANQALSEELTAVFLRRDKEDNLIHAWDDILDFIPLLVLSSPDAEISPGLDRLLGSALERMGVNDATENWLDHIALYYDTHNLKPALLHDFRAVMRKHVSIDGPLFERKEIRRVLGLSANVVGPGQQPPDNSIPSDPFARFRLRKG